jgi:hypothetical protein
MAHQKVKSAKNGYNNNTISVFLKTFESSEVWKEAIFSGEPIAGSIVLF